VLSAFALMGPMPRANAQDATSVSPAPPQLFRPIPRAPERTRAAHLQFDAGLARLFVGQAIQGASRRLETQACRQVFTDFDDERGRSLESRLEVTQGDAADFLSQLWFVDASSARPCTVEWAAAYTTPGSRVIFVCGSRFADTSASLQGMAGEMVIIHEVLHALGLGENPPTSAQITGQVTRRCGGTCPRPGPK
jgi:hypothetical protein